MLNGIIQKLLGDSTTTAQGSHEHTPAPVRVVIKSQVPASPYTGHSGSGPIPPADADLMRLMQAIAAVAASHGSCGQMEFQIDPRTERVVQAHFDLAGGLCVSVSRTR